MLFYSYLLLAILASPSRTADILVVLPFPQYSHVMPFMPIFKELGQRGHKLTVLTAFEQTPNPKGFTQIKVNINNQDFKEAMKNTSARATGQNMMRVARGPLFQMAGLVPLCRTLAPLILERTKPLLPPPGSKFDLVFIEPFFCMEPLVAASSLYDAPIVATIPLPLSPYSSSIIGNPLGFSYVPNFRIPFTGEMTFLERVWNTMVNTVELLLNHLYNLPRQDQLMRETFGLPQLPYIGDLLQNISLLITETHFALHYPRPYLKNVVEVGGISLQIAKPMPKDLETYMNEAESGVIYFSWGSHFEAPEAEKILEVLMRTFSKLKQRILFKWHTKIPNTPENVLVQDWFPQPSVLAHDKMKLFISHGGLNSIYEAVYYGVPVLGTPIFGDQPFNIRLLESIGMAISIDPEKLDDGVTFSSALDNMLHNSSFRENGKRWSNVIRDRPMDVVKEAVYWIEYILKHGGSHLQPVTKRMPWYSIAILDVTLFLFGIMVFAFLLLYLVIAMCLRLCRRKHSNSNTQKKKKKQKTQ